MLRWMMENTSPPKGNEDRNSKMEGQHKRGMYVVHLHNSWLLVWPWTEVSFWSNPLSNIVFIFTRPMGWGHRLNLLSKTWMTSFFPWKKTLTPSVWERNRRHAGFAGRASWEWECIRPLASTEASINEQPGNVSIQTHSAPGATGGRARATDDFGTWIIEVPVLNV